MRKLLMLSAALAAGMLSLSGATSQAAQETQPTQQMAAKSMKVTGMVTAANLGKQQITVDGQTFKMAMGGGAAVWPQVGADVTLYYQDRNGQKTVTRIGQAQSRNAMTAQNSQTGQQMAANQTGRVSGMVTEADPYQHQIVVDGQTFHMAMAGGATAWPQVGDSVILHYKEHNDQKTVTSMGDILG